MTEQLTSPEKSDAQFRKIFNHPDKEEIITKLLGGDSVRGVEAWLKKKYPIGKKNHVSYVTLQKFRSEYLNIEAEVLRDLQKERQALRVSHAHELRVEEVKSVDAYRSTVANYVQESLIDYNGTIKDLLERASKGIERLETLDENKGSHLNHAAIAGYLTQIKSFVELHHKMIKDQEKRQGNQVEKDYDSLRKQVDILKQVIKEIFQETAPELQPIFVSKVRERMEEAGFYD